MLDLSFQAQALCFGPFAIGDVPPDGDNVLRLVVLVADDRDVVFGQNSVPVFAYQRQFDRSASGLEDALEELAGPLEIFGTVV